jgi:hypothetical protein
LHAFARELGNGRVRFPRRTATLWALPWTPLRWRGVGTNPEYAVKSTDKFLTSLSRIQIEIKDQRKVPVLKIWVRRAPFGCCHEGQISGDGLKPGWPPGTKRGETQKSAGRWALALDAAAARGSEQTRNVP